MFTVYYSNQLAHHKDKLVELLQHFPNADPFSQETVLVQSVGMEQWLRKEIAQSVGISASIEFPFPTSFVWQQYRVLFPDLPKENIFSRATMAWRLMRLIPKYLSHPDFSALNHYLKENNDQVKLYLLANKVADLFDQYLVYRPDWLMAWEHNDFEKILGEFKNINKEDLLSSIKWQAILWNEIVNETKLNKEESKFNASHRAYLKDRYFEKLDSLTLLEKNKLPQRIFIFGISTLPLSQLEVLGKLSEHIDIHLFFTSPSGLDWWNDKEALVYEKLALREKISFEELKQAVEFSGNPLLSMWGKQGGSFFAQLVEQYEVEELEFGQFAEEETLLAQLKGSFADLEPSPTFSVSENDHSIQIHACHSEMREVEVLHNKLLQLFEQNPELSPKDIIVMSTDIEKYAPYISAVFSRYKNEEYQSSSRYIPFTISDQRVRLIDPILSSFLQLFSFKENQFTAENILALLSVQAIQDKLNLNQEKFEMIKSWVSSVGIRAGLNIDNQTWQNYNAWENGLDRLLLGQSLSEDEGIWQNSVAFNQSYGLTAELSGVLSYFVEQLSEWRAYLIESHNAQEWQSTLKAFIDKLYSERDDYAETILNLKQTIDKAFGYIEEVNFIEKLTSEVIENLLTEALDIQSNHLNFLAGKVNFCTLLPMRAIPFKVVCLLGMNEQDFPRQQRTNSFDLMQYSYRKGDRSKRDDDRYLFLEALLSAQQIFYVSYIGNSLKDNKEKLPSVLLSQLQDFIIEHLADKSDFERIFTRHSMTIFSQDNFRDNHIYQQTGTGKYISFDKEWISLNQEVGSDKIFSMPIELKEENIPHTISLQDLISFLQNPIKHFFNHRLGIYFYNEDQGWQETENFELSNLEQYTLLDKLLVTDQEEILLEQEKRKGNLLSAAFSSFVEQELSSTIKPIKKGLATYLKRDAALFEVDLGIDVNGLNFNLNGNIPNLFDNEIVQWRVGKLRDKDVIQSWVYYLAMVIATSENSEEIMSFKFYYRDKDKLAYLTFNPISKNDAATMLAQYIAEYLYSQKHLSIIIYDKLREYFAELPTELELANYCQSYLLDAQCAHNDGAYIQRVLDQDVNHLDYLTIHDRTLVWFEKMVQSVVITEVE
ncbi:exodeoxyribonuclease V subunit gamma [Haemophilus paracuniculus]|uniref:RecBCD enzyme subunit RecC n=1 Tax=Haemophilus paracuniculus TaxID=734 RepID=A0A1T0AQQ3_9PAST|nr:exodeoxyribonuclease V subunit gamma [Haemophilus paracuniculus]OOR98323.1 exodeoxyribonuclease V subunit gamma [Haemophilus paracuniculus]